MNGRVLFISHCLLNPYVKTDPRGPDGALQRALNDWALARAVGLVQMPCPELLWGGPLRWGVTKEQLRHSAAPVLWQRVIDEFFTPWEEFVRCGGRVLGVVGVKGSPSCGAGTTCRGYRGGEIGSLERCPQRAFSCRGTGLWIELCLRRWKRRSGGLTAVELDERLGAASVAVLDCLDA